MQKKVGVCAISILTTIILDAAFLLYIIVDLFSPRNVSGINYGVLFLVPVSIPLIFLIFLFSKMFKTTEFQTNAVIAFVFILISEFFISVFLGSVLGLEEFFGLFCSVDLIPFYLLLLLNLVVPLVTANISKKMIQPLRINAKIVYVCLLIVVFLGASVTAYSWTKAYAADKIVSEHEYYDDVELVERCFSLKIPQNAEFIETAKSFYAEGYKPCLKMKIKLDDSEVDNIKNQLNSFFNLNNGSKMTNEEISAYFIEGEKTGTPIYACVARVISTYENNPVSRRNFTAAAAILVDDAGGYSLCLLQQNGL